MDPQALQSDCCKARFMLNDILDGCNGNFDYEAKQLRDVFKGENFTTGFFIPQRVAKFLAQKKMAGHFAAVGALQLASTKDAKTMAKQVFDAVMDGFEKAKSAFESWSVALVPQAAAAIKKPKAKTLLQKAKKELDRYTEIKKFLKIDDETMLPPLLLFTRDLAEAMCGVAQAVDLRESTCGIHYCVTVPSSLLRSGWSSF